MSTSKNIDKICAVIMVLAVVATVIFMNGTAIGIRADDSVSLDYTDTLFDDSYVHTIDISIDNWDEFLENATSEEYVNADVTIDGETVKNVGIRGKGNTSLSTVSQMDSDRYSFKIEFDCYEASGNYMGLDKLCLNNLIQDNTMMKDYVAYKLMNEYGVASPLASYCYITVNGEDWGLYLAVEAIEDSFLMRNYGKSHGNLYKPDSMSMGGGRGNGRGFDMKDMDFDKMGMDNPFKNGGPGSVSGNNAEGFPDMGNPPDFGGDFPDMKDFLSGGPGDFGDRSMSGNSTGRGPGGFEGPPGGGPDGKGGFPGMGSDDVKLKYSDDNIDSYSSIFNSAKTNIKKSDKKRLIRSLKSLSEGAETGDSSLIEEAVNTDEVLRYMVVHSFVVNGDSYTGNMIHNYYLYEEDGLMSMIPWDYNLAFGTFQSGDAEGAVNDPIDTPGSISEGSNDRPMFSWITSNEEYTKLYHEYYRDFLDKFYTSGYLSELIENTYGMIADYVDRDPTKFCTTEEFKKGVQVMKEFVELRCQSIEGQLNGTIPSTDSGQKEDSSALIDASGLTLSDMGSMGGGPGGGPGEGPDGGPGRGPGGRPEGSDKKPRDN